MALTKESAVFMGKKFQKNQNSIVSTADLTLKQMFDISTKLVSEQDEISGLETIGLEKHSWKYLSLIGDERIIDLQRAKVYVFSDSVLCLGKIHQLPMFNEVWKESLGTIQNFIKNFENLTLKQMFDVTAQLVNNQDEINGLDKILWEKYSWTRLSLIGPQKGSSTS